MAFSRFASLVARGGQTVVVIILSYIIFVQRRRMQRMQKRLADIDDVGRILHQIKGYQPKSWSFSVGWSRGKSHHLMNAPTPERIADAIWLLTKAIAEKFKIEITGVQRRDRYISLDVAVTYEGKVLKPINAEYFHISLYEGDMCRRADIWKLKDFFARHAKDMHITGFLASQPCLFQTSMKLYCPSAVLDFIYDYAEDNQLEIFTTAKRGLHVAL